MFTTDACPSLLLVIAACVTGDNPVRRMPALRELESRELESTAEISSFKKTGGLLGFRSGEER